MTLCSAWVTVFVTNVTRGKKREYLRVAGAWNERARNVESPAFSQSDFFDPRDKVQVKYEMLRSARVDGVSVAEASRQHGYSRESFYKTAEAFEERGVLGLNDQKRGPRSAHKLTPEIQEFLSSEIEGNPSVASAELVERLRVQKSVIVHRRTIERFRSAGAKKNSG